MIFKFIIPIGIAVSLIFAWGAWFLPLKRPFLKNPPLKWGLKILFFCVNLFGLAYIIPLGPFYDPALHAPYPVVLGCAFLSAFAFFYCWIKIGQGFISIVLAVMGLVNRKILSLAKKLFVSVQFNVYAILVCSLLAFISLYQTIKVPDIKYVEISLKNLPEKLHGYTIAQITDTHTGLIFRKDWQEKVVRKILDEKPNLIVHTGDIGDAVPNKIAEHLAPLKKLHAPDGVWYIFGNHEKYNDFQAWREYFKDNGLNLLENKTVLVHDCLAITGATAYKENDFGNYGMAKAVIDYEKLYAKIPDTAFRLFLDHYPARFSEHAPHIDLQLSGHTHGGTVFFLAPLVGKANNGFVSGCYEKDNAKLYVSNGTGIWTYTAFRLLAPGEITLIKLAAE